MAMHDIDRELQHMLNGEFKEGRAISDKLEALGPDKIPDIDGNIGNKESDIWLRQMFNRGWFMLQDGDYQKGSQLLEAGRHLNTYGSSPLKTKAPMYNPNEHDIKGKSIIISLEGGFGDEIIHARWCKSFKNKGASKVYLAASIELLTVFECIEGCDGVILRNQVDTIEHDYWIPGFSGGWTAGHTYDDLPGKPYLTALPNSVEMWKNIISSDKIKVGIRWAGNPKFEHQQFRTFPPSYLTELTKYNDKIQLYSLQRDQNVIELPEEIIDLQHFLISWEDTLAAIANLDLVITSCTSIAHAAAALGIETWVLTPVLPYHIWAKGAPESTTSPYYDCVKIYRQSDPKSWNPTFQKLYNDLEKKFELEKVKHESQDKVGKKINLGCGYLKLDGFLNVDGSDAVEPDQVVDLNVLPWPFKDKEFGHIVAKDILEHLGNEQISLIDILKEMYRISDNGAIWEVQVPHHRSDHAWDDPTHKRPITPGTFRMLDLKKLYDGMALGRSDSTFAFEEGIDVTLADTKYIFTGPWMEMLKEEKITEKELEFALQTQCNVAESTIMLCQVNKPARYSVKDLNELMETRKKPKIIEQK